MWQGERSSWVLVLWVTGAVAVAVAGCSASGLSGVEPLDGAMGGADMGGAPDQGASGDLGAGPRTTFTGAPLPAGMGPRSVALADVDKDGALDVVVANGFANTLSVLRNAGDGTFPDARRDTYPVKRSPTAVVVGDLDGDKWPDLAVTAAGSDTVSVLLNKMDGHFPMNEGVAYSVEKGPVALALGDVNGDGAPDLVVGNGGSESVSVLLNQGKGTFPMASPTYPAGRFLYSLALGELRDKKQLDLVVADAGEDAVSLLWNQGPGTFAKDAQSQWPVRRTPVFVTVADLDGDGLPDLVVADYGSDSVSVLLNRGGGAFTTAHYPTGRKPVAIAAGDLDGDGLPDLAVANYGSDTVSVLINAGQGRFFVNPQNDQPTGALPTSVAIGDLDRDGRQDLVVANLMSNDLSVLINTTPKR